MKRGDLVVLKEQRDGFYHWNSVRVARGVHQGFYLQHLETRALLNGSLHANLGVCKFGIKDVCLILGTLGDQIHVINSSGQSGLIERGLVKVVG